MVRRLSDVLAASLALVALSPLFVVAAAGIRLSSPGPIFFRAQRVGRHRAPFRMYKFRTMHIDQRALVSTITVKQDPRVFPFGAWLRRFKIDELPQLLNIVKGEMSFIGPRPEDPQIVERFYAAVGLETLQVLPGLASPGSLYHYTHGESHVDPHDAEQSYIDRVLPIKLALDVVYVREASFLHDVRIVFRTIQTIASVARGTTTFPDPPEMDVAAQFIERTTRRDGDVDS